MFSILFMFGTKIAVQTKDAKSEEKNHFSQGIALFGCVIRNDYTNRVPK